MRILMVSDTYFPRVSGVASSIRSFRAGLARMGHEVHLLIPAYGVRDSVEPGIFQVSSRRIPFYPEERLMTLSGCLRIATHLASRRYDVIHIQTPFMAHFWGCYLARRWGIPAVLSYHTYFEAYVGHYYPWIPNVLARYAIRGLSRIQCHGVHTVVVPSAAMAEVVAGYGVRTPIEVIPTGIDMPSPPGRRRAAFRALHGITPERPVLLYAGRLAPEKNLPFLLQVVARLRSALPDILLLFAGDGPIRASLESQSRRYGLSDSVRFLGYLDRDGALRDAYQAADLFVFSSLTETQGMVLLEALAARLPIVAIPALGVADLLASRQGSRGSAADPDSFGAECLAILRDPALRARLATEAGQLAARWSREAMSQRLIEVYETLVDWAQAAHCGIQER